MPPPWKKCAAQVPRRQTAKRCASYWNICGKAITVIASVFLLPYRDGYISVQVKDISHIALDERNTLLCLNNGTSETVPYSLDELESQLNPDVFFRANRQYLIHIDSILSINNWFNSRLKIRLKKYPDVEIIVSRERAAELKGWLDR